MKSSTDKFTCVCCKENKSLPILYSGNEPISSQKLLSTPEPAKSRAMDVRICSYCGHIQLSGKEKTLALDSYDDNYSCSFTHSSEALNYQRNLANSFVEKFSVKGKNIVEIGCGDGFFLGELAKFKNRCIGYEPSAASMIASQNPYLEIKNTYFKIDEFHKEYDGATFIMRHVLEHIPNPLETLTHLHKYFTDSDSQYLFLEIPNVNKILHELRFFDFYHEHINYFSSYILRRLLEASGFRIVEKTLLKNDEFLINIAVRDKTKIDNKLSESRIQKRFNEISLDSVGEVKKLIFQSIEFKRNWIGYLKRIKDKIIDLHKNKNRIVAWGAGSRGVTLLSLCSFTSNEIEIVLDNDRKKENKFTPVSSIPIYHSDWLNDNKVDCIIVLSITYQSEILKQIKENYSKNVQKVLTLFPELQIIPIR